jgi:hypothetical protein
VHAPGLCVLISENNTRVPLPDEKICIELEICLPYDDDISPPLFVLSMSLYHSEQNGPEP